MTPSKSQIGILASAGDHAIAELLRQQLGVLGVELTPVIAGASQVFEAVVVVQGPDAIGDPIWRDGLAGLGSVRLVPVVVDGVPNVEVPEPLSDLNWIRWPGITGSAGPPTAAEASTSVLTALSSDLDRLQFHRKLEAEAQAWIEGDRDDALLVTDFRRASLLADHLSADDGDVLTRPEPELVEFVRASFAAAKRARRKRRWRWFRRGTAAAVALLLFAGILIDRKAHIANENLAVMLDGASQMEGRPDRGAMVAAATLVQGQPVALEMARRTLVERLSEPWSLGVLGVEETAGILDAAPLDDGEHVYSIDAVGRIADWDAKTAAALWQRDIGLEHSGRIAASPNGRLLAVVDGRRLAVAEVSPWRVRRYRLPVSGTAIAFDQASARFVVAGARGLVGVAADGSGGVEPVAGRVPVLDLENTAAGGTVALTEPRPGQLAAIDPLGSRPVLRPPALPAAAEQAAVGTAGEIVAAVEGRLLLSRGGGPWRPLGVEDQPSEQLRLLSGGILVTGGWATPLEMTDLASGVDIGPLCATTVGVYSIRTAPGRDLVACTDGWVTELWSTAGQVPSQQRPPGRYLGAKPDLRRGPITVRGGRDGVFQVTVGGHGPSAGKYELWAGQGAVEAVALNANGHSLVVGTERGGVAEFDLHHGNLTKTAQWQVPGGAGVSRVGWSRQAGRLLVGTAGGLWWRPSSCDLCQDAAAAVEQARRRFWGCYPSDALHFMSDETERYLGLTACQMPPEPS
jgi:hypothetical protein